MENLAKLNFVDTHTHLYMDEYASDRADCVKRAVEQGVSKMVLPNVDISTIDAMWKCCDEFPKNCFPSIGIHPSDITENYQADLKIIEKELQTRSYISVGEIGIDLYHDKTFFKEQEQAFIKQLEFAKAYQKPVVVHTRSAFEECMPILKKFQDGNLRAIFHCFSGSVEMAKRIIGEGFYLGIGGVVTFKNSNLPETLKHVNLNNLVLETDAPFLAPHPYRGNRNDSSYIPLIAEKIASIYEIGLDEVANITTQNAKDIFKFYS